MFIIYKSWYDSLTSMREPDFGYDVVGYVATEQEAKDIVKNGGNNPHYYKEAPNYKYEELEYVDNPHRQDV